MMPFRGVHEPPPSALQPPPSTLHQVLGLALLLAVRAQGDEDPGEESQESKDAAEAKEEKETKEPKVRRHVR